MTIYKKRKKSMSPCIPVDTDHMPTVSLTLDPENPMVTFVCSNH